jgi:hypothetical protein
MKRPLTVPPSRLPLVRVIATELARLTGSSASSCLGAAQRLLARALSGQGSPARPRRRRSLAHAS